MTDDFSHLRPAELTPAERAAAVAALFAAGLLRHLRSAAFPHPADLTSSQEESGEST
jgi:hypothetical protein